MISDRDFEVLRLRFAHKQSYRIIAESFGISTERVRQIISIALGKLLNEDRVRHWKLDNRMADFSDELMLLIYSIPQENRKRVRDLINELGIKSLEDFRKHALTGYVYKNIGHLTAVRIKLALLKLGVPHDEEDFESLEIKLQRLLKHGDQGLKLRFKIFERDQFTCQYCGRSPRKDPLVTLTIDHKTPISKGGMHEERNLIAACRECNVGKGQD